MCVQGQAADEETEGCVGSHFIRDSDFSSESELLSEPAFDPGFESRSDLGSESRYEASDRGGSSAQQKMIVRNPGSYVKVEQSRQSSVFGCISCTGPAIFVVFLLSLNAGLAILLHSQSVHFKASLYDTLASLNATLYHQSAELKSLKNSLGSQSAEMDRQSARLSSWKESTIGTIVVWPTGMMSLP